MSEDRQLKEELARLLEEKDRRLNQDKFHYYYFQDEMKNDMGLDVSRKHYKAHLEFFKAGAKYNQRAFVAANRVGKSVAGAWEMVTHLTGDYPHWWEGKRFDKPIRACAVGKTHKATRDVIQYELLGKWGEFGTGMIPADKLIGKPSAKTGTPRAVQDIDVRHVSGGVSTLTLMAYDQGQEVFMGSFYHVMWHDEECTDVQIYEECLMRTMSVDGVMYTTFTPLEGMSPVILSFFPNGKFPTGGVVRDDEGQSLGKYVVNCTWDDVPHLLEKNKKELMKQMQPHQRDARTRGIPSLGSGAVYPFLEDDVIVEPFPIPSWFKRAYGLDFGWRKTAGIWGAQDPTSGVIYIYSEHYQGKKSPVIHAEAIRARGEWIVGACDPSGGGMRNADGESLIQQYERLGLHLFPGSKNFRINPVEPGIAKVYGLIESGQLKFFSTLTETRAEYRMYRRELDKRGELTIHKENDHLMDALRYLIMAFEEIAMTEEDLDEYQPKHEDYNRSDITGY